MNYYLKTAASVETFLAQIRGRNTKSNKTIVYRSILKHPGCSKNDLIRRTGLPHQTVTSRVSVLMDLGLVEVTATRPIISSNSGSFESLFMVQKNPDKIKANQKARADLKLKRITKQLGQFKDIVPAYVLDELQTLQL